MLPDADTQLVVLLGDPVEHSLSPRLHNAAFRAQDVNAAYVAARVAPPHLEAAVRGLRAMGFLGANVTIPHKEAVLPLLDDATERARAVGAVNTVVRGGGSRLLGDNTDVTGFLAPLEPFTDELHGVEVLIFGAGGAARAVTYALLTAFGPTRLTLAARRPAQAEALAADFASCDARDALGVLPLSEAGPAVRRSRLLVNTTPLGMHPDTSGTPWAQSEDLSNGQIAYDLVYRPRETRFLRDAGSKGAAVIGGLEMLVGQAAAAYRQWTGRAMPRSSVRQVLAVGNGGKGRGGKGHGGEEE